MESLGRLYFRGNRYILWMSLSLVAPLVVYSRSIIDAYVGDTYADAAVVMAILLGR